MSAVRYASLIPIPPASMAKLRRLVDTFTSLDACAKAIGATRHTLEDALCGGRFRPDTVARIEAAIDSIGGDGT